MNINNKKTSKQPIKKPAAKRAYKPKSKPGKVVQKPVHINQVRGLVKSKSVDYHTKNVSGAYHKLEKPLNNPKLAFALGNVAGGRIKTPWAENAATSDTPTQLLAGTKSFTQTVGSNADYYSIVTLCPWGAYAYNGGSPISLANTSSVSTALVLANILGQTSMTDMFGTFSYSDRLIPFAATACVTLEAPAANLSGVVYVGSIQLASINEGSIVKPSDLIARATGTYSLSEKTSFQIRAGITNAAGIHQDATNGSLNGTKEEWVSYLIFHNPSRNITSGALSDYTLTINLQSNAIVSPDGSQPAIQGLVRETIDVPRFIPPNKNSIDEQNAECLARMNHSPELPSQWAKIVSMIKTGASIAGLVETGLSVLIPVAQMAATLLLMEPSSDDPLKGATSNRVRDAHNNIEWFLNKISQLSSSDLPDSVQKYLLNAIDNLQKAYDESDVLIEMYDDYTKFVLSCTTKERWESGKKVVDHISSDGEVVTWQRWKSNRESAFTKAIRQYSLPPDNAIQDIQVKNSNQTREMHDESMDSFRNVSKEYQRGNPGILHPKHGGRD